MNGLSVLASGGGGPWEHQRTRPQSWLLAEMVQHSHLYPAQVLLVLYPTQAPPERVSGGFQELRKALWNTKTIYGGRLSSPKVTVQPCHFICPPHRWSSCNPRIICELCQFTQQMPARNSEITSTSLLNSGLLSPLKTRLLFFKLLQGLFCLILEILSILIS